MSSKNGARDLLISKANVEAWLEAGMRTVGFLRDEEKDYRVAIDGPDMFPVKLVLVSVHQPVSEEGMVLVKSGKKKAQLR